MKAQSLVTEIGNNRPYGAYLDDGIGPADDQNVIINNNRSARPIQTINKILNPSVAVDLNFLGGVENQISGAQTAGGGSVNEVRGNFLYGKGNFIQESKFSTAFGTGNRIESGSKFSIALGSQNHITNSDRSLSLGKFTDNTNDESLLLGFGANSSNRLNSINKRSISLGTYNNNSNTAYNTLNVLPPSTFSKFDAPVTGIGTTSPSAKLEIKNTGESSSHSQTPGKALSVLNSSGNPLFNVREDGWTGFSADPSAPYYFTKTNKSPTGFSGGEGRANIVQDLGGFPSIVNSKYIAIGERQPDNQNNQIAYGYAATWKDFAGNFFLDDVNQNGTKDLTISFQDAGVSDPDNAGNRMRFIARDGDPVYNSGAFNELMSLYPEGEVAVGDYSGSVLPDAQLEVKGDPNDNISTLFEVLEGGASSSRGTEVLTVNDDSKVGINEPDPLNTIDISGNAVIGSGYASNSSVAVPNDGLIVEGASGIGVQSVNTSNYIFEINGDGFANGNSWIGSDNRFKRDLETIENPIDKLNQLRGLTYLYKNEGFPNKNFPDDRRSGIIAQELKEVLPEAVQKNDDGYYAVNYDGIIPLLIEANKSQQEEITRLKEKTQKVEELEQQVQELQQQMQELSNHTQNGANRFQNANKDNLNQKTVSIDASDNTKQAMLLQNRPNPHNGETVIPYYLPKDFENADLLILNTNGQMIKRVSLEKAGKGELTLRTGDLKSGQYLYSLVVDGRKINTRKMIIKR